MTREEAIEELKTRYLTMSQCLDKEEMHKANKAIDMAIEALEKLPCDPCLMSDNKLKECWDAISRQAVKAQMIKYGFHAPDMTVTEFIDDLPPVTPQQEVGKWVEHKRALEENGYLISMYECSICREWEKKKSDWCPNCGAKMIESQESEDKG